MAQKFCRCKKGKTEEEYIECPFDESERCPCNPDRCIVYRTYENGQSTYALLMTVADSLRAR